MTSQKVALESTKLPGGFAAMLVDSNGCMVESVSAVDGDLAAYGVAVSQMIRQWASVGTDLGMGTVHAMLIERPGGSATIMPMGQDIALVIVCNHACPPGRLRLHAKRAKEAMAAVAQTTSERNTGAPSRSPAHFENLAETIEEVSPSPPPGLTAGEVVLVGAHTFRLVTKLIAQLLQLKGVRSSRLRAYSPRSTIIDVVLEDGAALGTIDSSCLEEFSIERAEEGGTRLVVRAGRALGIFPAPVGSPG